MWHSVIYAHFGDCLDLGSDVEIEAEEVEVLVEAEALRGALEEDSPGSGKRVLEAKRAMVKHTAQLIKMKKVFLGFASNPRLLSSSSAPVARRSFSNASMLAARGLIFESQSAAMWVSAGSSHAGVRPSRFHGFPRLPSQNEAFCSS